MIANNPCPGEVVEACPELRLLNVAFTGIDHVGLDACRRHGITALKVAWSAEEPRRVSVPGAQGGPVRRDTPSSAIFVPAAMGLLIASEVVRDLCGINREERL